MLFGVSFYATSIQCLLKKKKRKKNMFGGGYYFDSVVLYFPRVAQSLLSGRSVCKEGKNRAAFSASQKILNIMKQNQHQENPKTSSKVLSTNPTKSLFFLSFFFVFFPSIFFFVIPFLVFLRFWAFYRWIMKRLRSVRLTWKRGKMERNW